jgi:hypothetical protein
MGCIDSISIVTYYWWDCFSAQQAYREDSSPNRPKGTTAWQDYGWHIGGNSQTQSHHGVEGEHWWDFGDGHHWNWQVAVLYVYCGKEGHYSAGIALSTPLLWTFDKGTWTNPEDGGWACFEKKDSKIGIFG